METFASTMAQRITNPPALLHDVSVPLPQEVRAEYLKKIHELQATGEKPKTHVMMFQGQPHCPYGHLVCERAAQQATNPRQWMEAQLARVKELDPSFEVDVQSTPHAALALGLARGRVLLAEDINWSHSVLFIDGICPIHTIADDPRTWQFPWEAITEAIRTYGSLARTND